MYDELFLISAFSRYSAFYSCLWCVLQYHECMMGCFYSVYSENAMHSILAYCYIMIIWLLVVSDVMHFILPISESIIIVWWACIFFRYCTSCSCLCSISWLYEIDLCWFISIHFRYWQSYTTWLQEVNLCSVERQHYFPLQVIQYKLFVCLLESR